MLDSCKSDGRSAACVSALQDSLAYSSTVEVWGYMNRDTLRSVKVALGEIYNSPSAENDFTNKIPDVRTRKNFFGAQNLYEQSNAGSGVRWFGGTETVNKARIVGLDRGGLLGDLAFRSPELVGVPTAEWGKEAGDKLMKEGFVNFKNLFNSRTSDPVV